jgi:hypothetical protein
VKGRIAGRWAGPLLFVAVAGLAAAGCRDDRTVEHYRVPRPEGTAAPHAVDTAPSSGEGSLTWTVPDGWEARPPSSMRLASFSIPTEAGPADCSVVVLSGSGGGLAANVNRWRGQVGLPSLPEDEVVATGKTVDGALGTFRTFRVENEGSPEAAFLVAVIPVGDRTVFVKLQAALPYLTGLESGFLAFCRSLETR